MPKTLLLFSFVVLIFFKCAAQAQVFNWGSSAGGSDDETIFDIAIPDSSIFPCSTGCPLTLVGTTKSDDGNLTNCNSLIAGNNQALVLKFNTFGTFDDCFSYGGTGSDQFYKGKYVKEGNGFHKIYLGKTTSNDGDVSGNHGVGDAWLVRTNADTIINKKCIGGAGDDAGLDFIEMHDHGFLICGYSNSNIINGVPMTQHGQFDGWVTRVDSVGNVIWSKRYGGNLTDALYSITRTADGNYVCVGQSNSTDSSFSVNHGANDYWIIKIDTVGNLLWQKIYGGSSSDDVYKVIDAGNNNIMISGSTSSFNGDVIGNHSTAGGSDVWMLKLDSVGNVIWKNCFGGSSLEFNRTMMKTSDDMIVVTATSTSMDGDLVGVVGYSGTWIFKIDSSGTMIWSRRCGSNGGEYPPTSIASYNSKTFYVLNHPLHSGGNVSTFYGGFNDIWLASITDTSNALGVQSVYESDFARIYPNPATSSIMISSNSQIGNLIELYNSQGILLTSKLSNEQTELIDLSHYPEGIYFVKVSNDSQLLTRKIIKSQ